MNWLLFEVQGVSHAVFLRFKIMSVELVWSYFNGDIFNDFQSVTFKTDAFYGVVGEQSHLAYAEVAEHLCATAIISLIGFEAKV